MARYCTNPPHVCQRILLLMLLMMCEVWMLRLLERFRPPPQLPLVAGHLKLICTIVNVFLPLKVLETAPSSLCHSSSLALVTLLDVRQLLHLALMMVQPPLKLMMLMIQVVEE